MFSRIAVWMLIVVALGGCGTPSISFDGDVTLSDGRVLSKATTTLFAEDGVRTVVFEYETTLDVVSCTAMRSEVRQVWSEYLQEVADSVEATDAQVAPMGRSSGVSFGFLLGRNSDGTWKELNFEICK